VELGKAAVALRWALAVLTSMIEGPRPPAPLGPRTANEGGSSDEG
jgi:hypothetical protein